MAQLYRMEAEVAVLAAATPKDKPVKAGPNKGAGTLAGPAAPRKAAKTARKATASAAPSSASVPATQAVASAKASPAKAPRATAPKIVLFQPDATGLIAMPGKKPPVQLATSPLATSPLAFFLAFKQIQQSLGPKSTAVWGLLPHDFERRTGLSTEQFQAAIKAQPGHDVYFCSAHPDLECLHVNPWYGPEVTHPGFVALCRKVFTAVGLPTSLLDARCQSSLFATGQLMVATPAFWQAYLNYVESFLVKARNQLDPAARAELFNEKPVAGRLSKLYLLVARLLGLMLMGQLRSPTPWKACKVELQPKGQPLNHPLALLREMKDRACATSDAWLADCWQQTRNLYLLEVMGKPWVQKHLAAISPQASTLWPAVPELHYPYSSTAAYQPPTA